MTDRRPRSPAGSYDTRVGGAYVLLALLVATPIAATWLADAFAVRDAPAFMLATTGLEDGTEGPPRNVSLADYRGRTLVLDLMAVACTTCRAVTREVLIPLQERHGARADFAILSIDTWTDPEAVPGFGETRDELLAQQRRDGVPWPHALDTDRVWDKYDAIALPKVVVIGPDGRIVLERFGAGVRLGPIDDAVEASLAGDAAARPVLRTGIVAGASLAGLAAFLSPCSVGLLPAYLGLVASREGRARALRSGLAVAAGLVAAYAVLAIALAAFALAGGGPWLRARLPQMLPVVAIALALAGLLALAPWGAGRLQAAGARLANRGMWGFGIAYGLAAFGCNGPVAIPVLGAAFLASPWLGAAAAAAFLATLAGLAIAVAALAGTGHGRIAHRIATSPWTLRAAALLMLAAAFWLLWQSRRAGVL